MQEIIIGPNDSGQKVDRFLKKAFPALPSTLIYKYIRLKRVKVNGKKVDSSYLLCRDDLLQLYINDDLLAQKPRETSWQSLSGDIDIVYEDSNIVLLNKPRGMLCHEDEDGEGDNLLNHLKARLFNQKQWNPDDEHSFAPALCNRIDRNTAGIVIAAKNAESLRIINQIIKDRLVDKYYLCLVFGEPKPQKGSLKGFILRDKAKKQVRVLASPARGALTAVTHYEVLQSKGGVSLVRCRLETGRTHQIRAQMASFGHPLLGDTKYGTLAQNKGIPFNHQALCSYKLTFSREGDFASLDYLQGKSFEIDHIFFMDYFDSL